MSEVVDDRAVPECRKRHEQNADAEQDEPRAVAQQIGGVLQHVRALVEGRVYSLARRGERDHEQYEGYRREKRHRRRVAECRPVTVERMEEGRGAGMV